MPWIQADGSIIDIHGRKINNEERFKINETVASLPAYNMREDFIKMVYSNRINIIIGATGSWKTTQLPKFLFQDNQKKHVIVTQPRVISCIANTLRVSDELLSETGNPRYSVWMQVWYKTWQWWVSSSHLSNLSFQTDAYELMRMLSSGRTPDYLIIDEVHNFSIPTEMLAMMTRYNKNIKIIIMSATLNPQIFHDYYKNISRDIPVLQIPGRTFPVEFYDNREENHIASICTRYHAWENIMLFVPGKKEIEDSISQLRKQLGSSAEIYGLSSASTREEQDFLLNKPAGSKNRIIVATNVAEESLTIGYLDTIFTEGKWKIARYTKDGTPGLWLENISKANIKQQSGRVWRTHNGTAIRVNSVDFDDLPEYPQAPMEKDMLDRQILVMLKFGMSIDDIKNYSSRKKENLFFHEFDKNLFRIAINRLKQIGAIDRQNNITPLGVDLIGFPTDVYNARILREAIKLDCFGEIIPIVAILEKQWFLSKDEQWKDLKIAKKHSKESDLFYYKALLEVLMSTQKISEQLLSQMTEMGVSREEIQIWKDLDGKAKFYEIVDLDILWIKNKKIKEIDVFIEKITQNAIRSGIEIHSKSTNEESILRALTAWHIHQAFRYDWKTKCFFPTDHVWEKTKENGFRWWKVSNIKPNAGEYYIGSPFIIGWDEERGDFHLLTNISHITEEMYRSASHISPSELESMNNNLRVKKWSVTESQEVYSGNMEKFWSFSIGSRFSDEDPKIYYINNCLVHFLIGHNNPIKKYLQKKNPDQIGQFKMLLSSLIRENYSQRVDIKNMDKTERSFRDDTTIMQDFLQSKNPFIRKFLRNQLTGTDLLAIEDTLWKSTDIDISFEDTTYDDIDTDHGAFEIQTKIATLMGKLKEYTSSNLTLEKINGNIIRKYVRSLETGTSEYTRIKDIIENMSDQQLRVDNKILKCITRDLKNNARKPSNQSINDLHVSRQIYDLLGTMLSRGFSEEYIKEQLPTIVIQLTRHLVTHMLNNHSAKASQKITFKKSLSDFLIKPGNIDIGEMNDVSTFYEDMQISLAHIESVRDMREILPDLLSVHELSTQKLSKKTPVPRFGWKKLPRQIPKTSNIKKLEQKLKKLEELHTLIINDREKYKKHPFFMDIWS